MKKNLIIVPTYNEKLNIKNLINNIFKYQNNFDLLFVDDNSPDGTAKIIKRFQSNNKNIFLILRKKNQVLDLHTKLH